MFNWLLDFDFAAVVVNAAKTATDDSSGQQQDAPLPLPFHHDLLHDDDIREDEELIEAVEAVVATAATTVKSEIVNDFNDLIAKFRSYVYWIFPMLQQSPEEIKSDLRKMATALILCVIVFVVLEPSHNYARRRRTKRMKARRKRAASWTAAMSDENGFFNSSSTTDELATATALDHSLLSGTRNRRRLLQQLDDDVEDGYYYDEDTPANDFERFQNQLWPNIISTSRYSKLVLPPSCRLVDKKNIIPSAVATTPSAAAAANNNNAPTTSSKRKSRREKNASSSRSAADNNDDDDNDNDNRNYRNYVNEDNPLQRLKNYVWWVWFLIKSLFLADFPRAGWTLLLWMQGIRQHRTKNINSGSGGNSNNTKKGVDSRGDAGNVNNVEEEDDDDDQTTDTTPVPDDDDDDDDENDTQDQQEEKRAAHDDVTDEENLGLPLRQQQEESAELVLPPTPPIAPSSSSMKNTPMPMMNGSSDNPTRNVSEGSVYYDLSSCDGDDENSTATSMANKVCITTIRGNNNSKSPKSLPSPSNFKSAFAHIHRLSLRRNKDQQRRSNPELSALANQRQPQTEKQQPTRGRPRTLSLAGNMTTLSPSRHAIDRLGPLPPESSSSRFLLGGTDSDGNDDDDLLTDDSNKGALLDDRSNTKQEEYYFASVQCEPSLAQLSRDVSLPDKNGYILGDEYLPDPRSDTPLLVFVNSRSGPQQGHLLITQLKRLLNPIQIWDLADGNPDAVLESFMVFTRLRILVCGGDGTVSWIVSSIDRMFQCNDNNNKNTVFNNSIRMQRGQNRAPKWPPIAILPLGTGNDLARFHGWGGGYNNESLIAILEQISESYISLLDRWEVTIEDQQDKKHQKKKKPSTSEVKKTFFNYLGVGADAQAALQVHNLRESKPGWFFSRLVNKAWYGVFGAEDIIMASSVNVRKEVTLFADGVEVELPPDSQGIILLNIDSYAGGVPLWSHGTKAQTARTTTATVFRRSRSMSAIQKLDIHENLHGRLDGLLPEDRIDSADDLQTILTEEENFARVTACDQPSSCQDGLLDICSIRGAFHLGQIRVGLSNAQRLCQCREAKIVIKNKVAVQIDGEPWRQRPCTITIKRKEESAVMLHRSADDSAIETEMSKLLDWAEERRYIDSEVHSVLMKEFSRRIENKTRKRRVREREKNIMLKTLKKAISSGGMNSSIHNIPTPPPHQKHQVLNESESWLGLWEGEMVF